MDPRGDIDRELAAAINVDPHVDFNARVHARIAQETPASTSLLPWLLVPALTCLLIATAIASMPRWRSEPTTREATMVLPHADSVIVSPLPAAMAPAKTRTSPREVRVRLHPKTAVSHVLVAASEMRELQRLFSGAIVAPPLPTPAADELSIPMLTIDPILPFPSNFEGDRQ